MAPRKRAGKGSADKLIKALDYVAKSGIVGDVLSGVNPTAGSIAKRAGLGKKKAPRKGAGLFDFLGLGKKKAPKKRSPKKGKGFGSFIKGLIKAPIQIVAPALAGGIMGTSAGATQGIDSVGNGKRRRRGGAKMLPAVMPPSQLLR